MEIPLDLQELCTGNVTADQELASLFCPPQEIVEEVRAFFTTGKVSDLLAGWIPTQMRLFEEARNLAEQLPIFDGTSMPGWMGSKWSLQLGCPWSAGLAEAVAEGKAWIASQ